jgi:hypothetical protein
MKKKPKTFLTGTSELCYGDQGLSLSRRDDYFDDNDGDGFKSKVITNIYKLYHREIVLVKLLSDLRFPC